MGNNASSVRGRVTHCSLKRRYKAGNKELQGVSFWTRGDGSTVHYIEEAKVENRENVECSFELNEGDQARLWDSLTPELLQLVQVFRKFTAL